MTNVKKIIIGSLISVVTLGGLIAYASPGETFCQLGGTPEKKAEFFVNRISSKLDLDEVQKQHLIALKDTIIEQRKAHHQDNPREALIKLLSEPELDEAKVLSMMEERATQIREAAPTVIAAIAKFSNSLNNEQREKIKGISENFSRFRGRFGRHFGQSHRKHQSNSDQSEL